MFTRDSIRFGIIAGILPLLAMLTGNLMGWYAQFPERVFAVFFMATSFGTLVSVMAAITRRRKALNPGETLSFKGSFRIGAAVSLIATVLVVVSMPLYFDILDPTWREAMANSAQARMIKEGLKESQIQAQVEALNGMTTFKLILRGATTSLMTGLLESGVVAFIIRTLPVRE